MATKENDQDPSIEEILASIRQIISDDDEPEDNASAAHDEDSETAPVPKGEDNPADTVLDLTADMQAEDDLADALAAVSVIMPDDLSEDADEEDAFDALSLTVSPPPVKEAPKAPKAKAEPVKAEKPAVKAEAKKAPEKEDAVIDFIAKNEQQHEEDFSLADDTDSAADAVEEIFTDTASEATMDAFSKLAENVAISRSMGLAGQGITLEEIVKDLLRPMLRQWVHENMPRLVEALVEKELEKLARRARDE